jgi:predicted DNA-binding transcriptional regulator AlpA
MTTNNHDPSKKYMRKSAVAKRYGVSERSIDRWCKIGKLPPPVYLPGGRIPLFAEDELDTWDRQATKQSAYHRIERAA